VTQSPVGVEDSEVDLGAKRPQELSAQCLTLHPTSPSPEGHFLFSRATVQWIVNTSFEARSSRTTSLWKTHGFLKSLESSNILYREVATAALHNSSERFDAPKCHPNTRLAVLSEIMKWIKWEGDINSFIMWLYGPTGAGKSAIAQTIAEMCEEEMILLASFFFSRTDPSRNNIRSLIATIAYQITLNIPEVRDAILGTVARDPLIFSKSLAIQFKSLIVEPLRQLMEAGLFNEPNSRRLVIIDGLDECVNPKVQRNILEVLANAQRQHRLPLMFLFASRPEQHISLAFNTAILPTATTYIALDESFLPGDDIQLSCNKFQDIKSTRCPPPNISQQFVEKEVGSTSRSVFRGPRRKLVLAFDVGTKCSGISYR